MRSIRGWPNWGDHPLVVAILLVTAIVGAGASVRSCANDSQQRDARTTAAAPESHHTVEDEFLAEYTEAAKDYAEAQKDASISRLELAKRKLKYVQAERGWVASSGLTRQENVARSESDRDWRTYNALLREEDRSSIELEAYDTIKREDMQMYVRVDGERRASRLRELLPRVRHDIKVLEAKYPDYWRKAHVQDVQ